jgi:hypothetical protein
MRVHWPRFVSVMAVVLTGTLPLASCGGDDARSDDEQTQEEELVALYERFLTAQVDGNVEAYCDSAMLLTLDLGTYKRAELDRELEKSDRFCEPDLAKEFERRGDLDASVEIIEADITVNGYKAKGRVAFEIDGDMQSNTPQFVRPPGYDWRVAVTG